VKSKYFIVTFALLLPLLSCGRKKITPVEPYKTSDETMFLGSLMYSQQSCQNCHGVEWDGKGPEAAAQPAPVPSFTAQVAADKTPLTYFKIITAGTDKMPSHAYQSLTDAGRWAMANFLYSLRKPLPAEKAEEQNRKIEADMATTREKYAELQAKNERRWIIGFKPPAERDHAPDLKDILKVAGVTSDSAPGVVSEERRNRAQSGEGADLYQTNCASCHGRYGEGKSITYGMGLIHGPDMKNPERKVRTSITTSDLVGSDSIRSGTALKASHDAGSLLQSNFDSFTDAEWAALSEFIRSMVQ